MPLGFADLPLWQCFLLAFLPVIIIAVIGAVLSPRVKQSNDNLMTSVGRISGAALVFICSFMIITLWQQTTSFLESWRGEYRAAVELQRTADVVVGSKNTSVQNAVTDYVRAVHDTEVQPAGDWKGYWQGSPEATQALIAAAAAAETTAATLPPDQALELRNGIQRLEDARVQRFERSVQPGAPTVILFTVMLLAWCTTLILGLYPQGGQRGVKTFQVTMTIVVIGLLQVPVYYLIGTGPVRQFVSDLFMP